MLHYMNSQKGIYKSILLTDWRFNGTLTEGGQFVPTVVKENPLSRQKMANKIQVKT